VIVTTLLEIMQWYLEGPHTYKGGSNNTLVKTNSGLYDLYSSPNINCGNETKEDEKGKPCSMYAQKKSTLSFVQTA
jgi:hypothetical protein